MKYLVPICALFTLSCTAIVDGEKGGQTNDPKIIPPTTGSGSGGTAPGSTTAATPFKVRNTEPELIPFEMRLRRIASALGVDANSPMFTDMHTNSLRLGDYDFANGALPDSSWNANRISAWVNALKPVCASAEMKAKYPELPTHLPQLIRAAWGHAPSAEDTAEFAAAITESGLDAAVAYETTCMAVFSAAEFVYR